MTEGQGTPGDVGARLLAQRSLVLGTQVDDALAERVVGQILLLDAEDPGQDISLYLNSPGGALAAGMAVLDTMSHVTAEIRTYGTGLAAGIASLLLAAGAPGKRFVLPRCRVHLDAPRSRDATPEERDLLARHADGSAALYARYTGRPVDRVAADLAAGTWFDATGAVAYGFADAVIGQGG